MHTELTATLQRLLADNRTPCGELGWIQCTAWVALDTGLEFDQWASWLSATVAAAGNQMVPAPATLRKQFRLAECDRNACLLDDGAGDQQTT